jgi:hypothetical protein
VAGRAKHLPGRRHALHVDQLRDAKVGQLHVARLVEHHVLGLHVAMDHALRVGRPERARDEDRHACRDLGRDLGVVVDQLLQGGPGQQLGGDVAGVAVLAAVVVDLEDVRVAQPRDRHGFAGEACARLLRTLQVRVHHLQRDQAIELGIACPVHRRHAAVADLIEDLVLP